MTSQKWQKIMNQFKTSGLSRKQFCKEHDLGIDSFNRWHIKILGHVRNAKKTNTSQLSDKTSFLEVKVDPQIPTAKENSNDSMTVNIGKSSVEVNANFNQDLFKDIVRVLVDLC
jgi:hypothetical protein